MGAPRLVPHDPSELVKLLSWVRGASSLLEIGSRYGYTLMHLAHELKPGAKIVCVDLPDQEGWNDPEAIKHLRNNIKTLKSEGYDVTFFEGDSHSPGIVEAVNKLGPFEVVFIDGDHTFSGVYLDWKSYGHLGNRVIFHDIREPQPPEWMGLGVWQLWEMIEGEKEEFLAPGSKMGIGKVERAPVSA